MGDLEESKIGKVVGEIDRAHDWCHSLGHSRHMDPYRANSGGCMEFLPLSGSLRINEQNDGKFGKSLVIIVLVGGVTMVYGMIFTIGYCFGLMIFE